MKLVPFTREIAAMRAVSGLFFCLCWAAAEPANAQGSYTDAQIKLAGQIGAVMGLVERCGAAKMPSAAILRAMKAEGLQETDMTGDTAFKARVVKQIETVKIMDGVAANAGRSERERRKSACSQLTGMYGPEGTVRAGLAAPR
jgi:hypothetical protein